MKKKSYTFHRKHPNPKLLCLPYATVRMIFFSSLNSKVSETFALPSARPHAGTFLYLVIVGRGRRKVNGGAGKVKSPCVVLLIYTFISVHIHLWRNKATEVS